MRLIDADKLKEKMEAHKRFYVNAYGGFEKMPYAEKVRVDEITSFIADIVNASTVEVPTWIPVTERLPEKGGYYLVHHKHGLISERLFYEGQGELFVNVKHDPVTHWMPLPDAPMKEDGNA